MPYLSEAAFSADAVLKKKKQKQVPAQISMEQKESLQIQPDSNIWETTQCPTGKQFR